MRAPDRSMVPQVMPVLLYRHVLSSTKNRR